MRFMVEERTTYHLFVDGGIELKKHMPITVFPVRLADINQWNYDEEQIAQKVEYPYIQGYLLQLLEDELIILTEDDMEYEIQYDDILEIETGFAEEF